MNTKFEKQTKTESKREPHALQEYTENILKKHGTNPEAFAYIVQLSIPGMNDLVIHKKGQEINLGYNYHFLSTTGELIPDIIISFIVDNESNWNPVIVEKVDFDNSPEDKERLDELTDILKGQAWLGKGKLNCQAQLDSKFQNIS